MRPLTMRERILAVVQGRELDRVPLVMYEGILPAAKVQSFLGRQRIGLMRWSNIHRVQYPHCRFETRDYYVDSRRWQRNTIVTSAGSIFEERAFETVYGSSSIRKHYVQEPADYEVLWAYLNDAVILEDYDRYYRDQAELGDDGTPLVAVERTPYQQLWVQWVGLDMLGYHLADCPDRVEHTVELLRQRARRINELAASLAGPLYRLSR